MQDLYFDPSCGTIAMPEALYPSFQSILPRKGLTDMKVLLLKDVLNLGRAGDVKRVADGFGRNFLLPQGLAVLATPGALRQVEAIRTQSDRSPGRTQFGNVQCRGSAQGRFRHLRQPRR